MKTNRYTLLYGKDAKFAVEVTGNFKKFITDDTKLLGEHATIGEANRHYIHLALDEFLDNLK